MRIIMHIVGVHPFSANEDLGGQLFEMGECIHEPRNEFVLFG